jgi:hypothetical protein
VPAAYHNHQASAPAAPCVLPVLQAAISSNSSFQDVPLFVFVLEPWHHVLVLSAVPLQVRVGSMSDPNELPGLAHFCEHMLFYSSEKYPVEDDYSR